MTTNEKYMQRCLQLARKGEGFVHPNPMVGSVIVCNGKIIGEGYHRRYGGAHAEANAINSLKDRDLLSKSTLYVSLEPCAHFGKTPPCAKLIVDCGIRKVVVAVADPNPLVSGKGMEILRNAGVEVIVGVLEAEAKMLNRAFFLNQTAKRPYVILKWAQSADGFIDRNRIPGDGKVPVGFSNELSAMAVHRLRTQVQAIMVGTDTARLDDPKLTSRLWFGENPVRVVIDKDGRLPGDAAIFSSDSDVVVFTAVSDYKMTGRNVKPITIDFEGDTNEQMLNELYGLNIRSLMVEGGAQLLHSFIRKGLWDEAFVEVSPTILGAGVAAPEIDLLRADYERFQDNTRYHLKNETTQKFI